MREFVEHAFSYAGIMLEWEGSERGENDIVNKVEIKETHIRPGDSIVEIDPHYFRPAGVEYLRADCSKARRQLDWEPSVKFKDLIKIMVDADMELTGLVARGEGKK